MTVLNKVEITTPSLVDFLQQIEAKQAEGYIIGYEGYDTPFQTGNLFVAYMCLHGEESVVPVKPAATKTPAKKVV